MGDLLIAATVAPYKLTGPHAEEMWAWCADAGWIDADWLFAVQGIGPVARETVDEFRLRVPGGLVTRFTLSEPGDADRVTNEMRLRRICHGRNLISAWAVDRAYGHVLFVDVDVALRAHHVDALREMVTGERAVYSLDVPSYCLSGRPVDGWPFPVERRDYNTAGIVMFPLAVLREVRWRVDLAAGLTDDPCMGVDLARLGVPWYVRTDVIVHHPPLVPFDRRGHDLGAQ